MKYAGWRLPEKDSLGNLLCPFRGTRNCGKWDETSGVFVKTTVFLKTEKFGHLCWPRKNGVLLLGGDKSPKERFKRT